MVDMIREIYESGFYENRQCSEKYLALCEEEAAVMEKVQSIIGLPMVNEISAAQTAVTNEENLDWFRIGFRLGASLMLELR